MLIITPLSGKQTNKLKSIYVKNGFSCMKNRENFNENFTNKSTCTHSNAISLQFYVFVSVYVKIKIRGKITLYVINN